MYKLKTESSFDAAHFLTDYHGKCENLHGHRWRVVAYLAQLQESTGCYGFCKIHDIVQQKETKKELRTAKMEVEETHKERNEMVANVTHELRTPVNGVLGLAQNLLDTGLDSEQRETIELIIQCCNNMIKIINNILDFSKIQANLL